MKYFKTIVSVLFILFILVSLIYKNIIASTDDNSILKKAGDFVFPAFMIFSFFLLSLKRRDDKKSKQKLTDKDRELYNSVGQSDYNKKK